MRIIKKYSNRRLYDTHRSTYVTLDDLKTLVIQHELFQVRDDKTQEDLTVPTLLQIIVECESASQPMLTQLLLEHLIRMHHHPFKSVLVQQLEQWFSWMLKQKEVYSGSWWQPWWSSVSTSAGSEPSVKSSFHATES